MLTSLIPDTKAQTPNYWCTWWRQGSQASRGLGRLEDLLDETGALIQRALLNQSLLFGPDGYLAGLFPAVCRELFLILDDGWDIPIPQGPDQKAAYGSLEPDPERWPGCTGSPADRLAQLAALARAAGWRGLGLWICAQEAQREIPAENLTPQLQLDYWRKRLQWSHQANIGYWKVDWGKWSRDQRGLEFRSMLTREARQIAPNLIIEHTVCRWPINDFEGTTGRQVGDVIEKTHQTLAFSDAFRTYDVLPQLSVPTTLDRVAQFLSSPAPAPPALGLLQCEDEAALAAVLGCSFGVMRHPRPADIIHSLCYGGQRFENARPLARQLDEITRAIHWQRIAPAWSVNPAETIFTDPNVLFDQWHFVPGDTTFSTVHGKTIRQGAPARVARNIAPPQVTPDASGQFPYVIASRHPGGAVALATLGRVSNTTGYTIPLADIRLHVGYPQAPIGVFGPTRSLTLTFDHPLPPTARILAQDLAAAAPTDITPQARRDHNQLTLPGQLLSQIGLQAATPGDLSPPALVLQIT